MMVPAADTRARTDMIKDAIVQLKDRNGSRFVAVA